MVYIGNNGKAASVSEIKIGDDNSKAANVVGGWAGDENGKARRIWSLDRPMWKFTCQNGVNLHVSGSGLAIDYGDGASENIGTQTSLYRISHAYEDTAPHQVTLYGVLTYLQFWRSDDGELAENYLLSVDTPLPKNRIAKLVGVFNGCTSLTSIPTGLFDNCPNVTNFDSVFNGCTSLTSIPSGLFDNCTAVTDFSYAFHNCRSLTSIPSGLFDNCTAVTDFGSTFSDCTNLASIPAGLFDNCTAVTSFGSTFSDCTNLASIPAGLFDNCPNVTDFSYAFWGCAAIASAVPELWDTAKWPDVTEHDTCFYNCTNAANYADIPEGWK